MFSSKKLTSIFSKRKSSAPAESNEETKDIGVDSEGKTSASTPDCISSKSAYNEMSEQRKAERAEEIIALS